MIATFSLLIIAAAVLAVARRAEVRLALLLAALALGALAGNVPAIVRTFLATLTNEQFLVPIGCSMGFAYVLRHTQCDRHLVQLLTQPLRRVRPLLIPGVVLVGAVVNVPIISQTSTAVAVGSVLVPLLRAAGVSPITTGAALLLGSSVGGELLNPGAPELRTISTAVHADSADCVARVVPLLPVQLAVSTAVFWLLSLRAEARLRKEAETWSAAPEEAAAEEPSFRVNVVKALIPLVPLLLLFLTALPHFRAFNVPRGWLAEEGTPLQTFDSRLIGAAMLVGVVLAAGTDWRRAGGTARVFFEGVGYAVTNITSLIVAAVCFGKGIALTGLNQDFGRLLEGRPGLLLPGAAALPLSFAWTCGSGMASTQSLFLFFVEPAQALGYDPLRIGAVVALAAAAGRTLSPVAAVTLMCATLTDTSPFDLVRRLAVPLLAGVTAVVVAAMF